MIGKQKMNRTLKSLAAIAVIAAVFAPAAHANLIVNGSFEQHTLPTTGVLGSGGLTHAGTLNSGEWQIVKNTAATGFLPGWTSGPLGIELRNNVAGTADDGDIYAELDTNGNSFASQLITTSGHWYEVAFAFSPRMGVCRLATGCPPNTPSGNRIDVYWNNAFIGSADGSGIGYNNNIWQYYTFNVQSNSTPSTLEFRAAGTSDSYGGSLDSIAVTAVPEPGTLALLGLGLAGLGWVRRRKAVF